MVCGFFFINIKKAISTVICIFKEISMEIFLNGAHIVVRGSTLPFKQALHFL